MIKPAIGQKWERKGVVIELRKAEPDKARVGFFAVHVIRGEAEGRWMHPTNLLRFGWVRVTDAEVKKP